jgi:hypothetical protein
LRDKQAKKVEDAEEKLLEWDIPIEKWVDETKEKGTT